MRDKHLFQFRADEVAGAAKAEALYHRDREQYWRAEYANAVCIVKETAKIEVKEVGITGGTRADLSISYGDMAAYRRMQEAFDKIQSHRQNAERLETDARVYATQDTRVYELGTDDVHYYRLGESPREE